METRRSSSRGSPRASSLALARGPAFFWLAVAGIALLLVPVLVPGLAVLGLLALHSFGPRVALMLAVLFWAGDVLVVRYGLLGALVGSRRLAQITRRLSDEWLQIPIRDSYVRATKSPAQRRLTPQGAKAFRRIVISVFRPLISLKSDVVRVAGR